MRKWEWVKTVLAAAAAIALMLFLGDRKAVYSWVEAMIYIGILAGGYYGGMPGGIMAGGIGGFLRWYLVGGELLQVVALLAGGVCCAFFRQLGKGASCLAFLSGTAVLYLLLDVQIPSSLFEALLVSLAVFLIVSPPKKRRLLNGRHRQTGGAVPEESAAALAPESRNMFQRLMSGKMSAFQAADPVKETGDGKTDFSAAATGRTWRRLADNFMTLANCFDDQSLLMMAEMEEKLTAAEWKQRFLESRQAIRLQFLETGQVILEQQERIAARSDVTEQYEGKIEACLKRHRVFLKQLQIMENPDGRQEIFARLACKQGTHLSAKEAASLFHTEYGKKFCPAYDCRSVVSTRDGDVHFIEKQNFHVLYGLARKNKMGEDCSGDSFSVKMLGEEKMLLCLSDGMGTGKRAGLESEMVVEFLEQLLENGFSVMGAVSMINHILLNWRCRQTPTTLDICVLDLYSGICQFVKMGAAAGYLKRGKSVSAVRGQTVPLGMISWDSMEQGKVPEEQLQSGDMLIMMTDGVSEKAGLAADEILKELISECTIRNAEEMAGWLMDQLLLLDDTIRDDMTILVAGVWKKQPNR